MAISKQVVAKNAFMPTRSDVEGLMRGKRSVKMDGIVQSHVVLLVVDGIMMMISVLLITTDQKDLRPERQVQAKEIILSYSFKQ